MEAIKRIRMFGYKNLIFGMARSDDLLDREVQSFLDAGADCIIGEVRFKFFSFKFMILIRLCTCLL